MAKWADYLISAIWETTANGSKYISYVFLHQDTDTTFMNGVKTSRTDVIKLLKTNKTIKTIQWNYNQGSWNIGAAVGYVTISNVEYLRTHQDGTVNDNLNNMINMNNFV